MHGFHGVLAVALLRSGLVRRHYRLLLFDVALEIR
jgi:hypothetical protein